MNSKLKMVAHLYCMHVNESAIPFCYYFRLQVLNKILISFMQTYFDFLKCLYAIKR